MRRWISDEPVRLEVLRVRLTDDEKFAIRERARMAGLPMAVLVRQLALSLPVGMPEQFPEDYPEDVVSTAYRLAPESALLAEDIAFEIMMDRARHFSQHPA